MAVQLRRFYTCRCYALHFARLTLLLPDVRTNKPITDLSTDVVKIVTCNAIDEARRSGGFALYAYVIMPDHFHVISDSSLPSAEILRFINGIVGRRIIDYLKANGWESSGKV